MKLFSYQKRHRLTLKRDIEALFRQGKSFRCGLLRMVYLTGTGDAGGIKVLITVPRKRFRNATDRNRIRRMIREAYRLNRNLYIPDSLVSEICVHTGIIYAGERAVPAFDIIAEHVSECLKKLAAEIQELKVKD